MDTNQQRSDSLKTYWQGAIARREQLREEMKGRNNPARSFVVRKKISENKRGKHFKHIRPISEKQRLHLLRLAELKRGKRHSLETRMRISLSRRGKCKGPENYFYGKQHTRNSVEKIKLSQQTRHYIHLQEIKKKAEQLGFSFSNRVEENRKIGALQSSNNRIEPLGYIIGTIPTDAYFDKPVSKDNYIYAIGVKDKDFLETIVSCFKDIFGFKPNMTRQKNLYRIQVSKKQIAQFLRFLKKDNDGNWVFNEKFFDLDHNFCRSALVAICDAEGCVTNSYLKGNIISRKITVTNSSLLLLKQAKILLELFGIKSYIYYHRGPRIAKIHNKPCYFKKQVFVLIITGYKNLQKFKDMIGFCIRRKHYKLENILNSYKNISRCYDQDEYNLALKLNKHFPNYCDISKLINIPSGTIRNWLLYNRKPRSIRGALFK